VVLPDGAAPKSAKDDRKLNQPLVEAPARVHLQELACSYRVRCGQLPLGGPTRNMIAPFIATKLAASISVIR
jgi:hypothetical protein